MNLENTFWNRHFLMCLVTHGNEMILKGIPINEEWLVKMGFAKNDLLFNIVINAYEFEIDLAYETSLFFRLKKYNNGWIEIFNIQYVHQLQNLIYAITQTELEIQK
jgi:hypothetical protein